MSEAKRLLESWVKPAPVVEPGTFGFAVAAMEHGHIYGQVAGLVEAGATLLWVYDEADPARAAELAEKHGARHAPDLGAILTDDAVRLVAAAAVPSERAALGIRCMEAGKDYFTDKTPLTSHEQLAAVREAVVRTGQIYAVYYSERLHNESAVFAGALVEAGLVGRVVHVTGFGPHRIGSISGRPEWFFRRDRYGGILCDIGSHQIEQFLHYAGETDAAVQAAKVGNYAHPQFPELEDFGDATLIGAKGATMYFRVDWLNPDGLRAFGDGRTLIIGTEGYLELRKFVNVAEENGRGDHLFYVNADGEYRLDVRGRIGFPYFGRLIRDCLDRSETAMPQAHTLKAAELCVEAQRVAQHLTAG